MKTTKTKAPAPVLRIDEVIEHARRLKNHLDRIFESRSKHVHPPAGQLKLLATMIEDAASHPAFADTTEDPNGKF